MSMFFLRIYRSFYSVVALIITIGLSPCVYAASAPALLKDIKVGTSSSHHEGTIFVATDNFAVFKAEDAETGFELWKTDGTPEGTELVKDIYPGSDGDNPYDSDPSLLTRVGDTIYFTASDGVHGLELWKTDGTEEGTVMVADIYEGSGGAQINNVFGVEDWLYFNASADGGNSYLYKLQEGGQPELISGNYAPDRGFVFGDILYFLGSEGEGTYGVWKVQNGESPELLQEMNDTYFDRNMIGENVAYTFSNNGIQNGVWKITSEDGMEFLSEDSDYHEEAITIDDTLYYFSAGEGELLLKKQLSDGTNETIKSLSDESTPDDLVRIDNAFYFQYQNQIWKSDGTTDGTALLEDIGGDTPEQLFSTGTEVYFAAHNSENGREPWKTDGTEEGTVMVADIYEGTFVNDQDETVAYSSSPIIFALLNTTLLFYAMDGEHGREPWYISDLTLSEEEEEDPESEEEPVVSNGKAGRRRSPINKTVVIPPPSSIIETHSVFTRDLAFGTTGNDVRELQRFLNMHGFPLAATGPGSLNNETSTFGTLTREALVKFQAAIGITPANGEFTALTRIFVSIFSAGTPISAVTTPVPVPATGVRDLDIGMTGDDVQALQTLLIREGYAIPAGITGFFADQTKAALAAYQRDHGITPAVGYFGPVTRAQMKAAGLLGLWW